jgi:Holliday junction resolvase RusA-like endonuclease
MKQEFFIPFRMPGLNDYVKVERGNKYAAAKMKLEYTGLAKLYAQQAKLTPYTLPVRIGFTWREPNDKRDPDNIIFAKKFVLDGLVAAGIIPNDNQTWIHGFLPETWYKVDKQDVGVLVRIQGAHYVKEEE